MQRLWFVVYKMWHELFSRKGFTFWLENPTSKQSSCSCSVTYLMMSSQACDTFTRWMDASRLNCSTTWRVFCKLDAIMSILLVSLLGKWQRKWEKKKWEKKTGNCIRFCEAKQVSNTHFHATFTPSPTIFYLISADLLISVTCIVLVSCVASVFVCILQ